MNKIKNIMTTLILLVGIIIGVVGYASVQDNANSKEVEPNFTFGRIEPGDLEGILIGCNISMNWSISMPNSSIDLRSHNNTHVNYSITYNDIEIFSCIVDRNTSIDIKDFLIHLVEMIQYYSSYVEPQEIILSDSNTFHYTEDGLIYYDELLGIWCNPV